VLHCAACFGSKIQKLSSKGGTFRFEMALKKQKSKIANFNGSTWDIKGGNAVNVPISLCLGNDSYGDWLKSRFQQNTIVPEMIFVYNVDHSTNF
jgi:hypothetical protein